MIFFFCFFTVSNANSKTDPVYVRPSVTFEDRQKHFAKIRNDLQSCYPKCIFNPKFKSPSKVISLSDLKPITLSEMRFPFQHIGHFLLCRTISDPIISLLVNVLVEDIKGEVEILSLYGILDHNQSLPNGTIFIIKEPFLDSENNHTLIRCSSPSDVIFVDECDSNLLHGTPFLKSCKLNSKELIQQTSLLFEKRDFYNALKCCNRALVISPNDPNLIITKSRILLEMKRYYESHETLISFSRLDSAKSLPLLAQSAYEMRNWTLAAEYYSKLTKLFPKNESFSAQLQRVTQRIKESKTGEYDFDLLAEKWFEANLRGENFFADIADYIGPVEIRDNNGYKYAVASRDIKRGTLLFVSKAVVFVDGDSEFRENKLVNSIDGSWIYPETFTIQKALVPYLKKNPHRINEVHTLYSGSVDRNEVLPFGVVDPRRLEQIVIFNSFGSHNPYLDIEVSFRTTTLNLTNVFGLWVFPALLNHHCSHNAQRVFYGDTMLAYALKDLKKGEEITFTYTATNVPFSKRSSHFVHHFGFNCTCELCTEQKRDKLNGYRYDLFRNMTNVISNYMKQGNGKDAMAAQAFLVQKLEETYHQKLIKYRFPLSHALFRLGVWQISFNMFKEATQSFLRAASFPSDACEFRISLFIRIAFCYNSLNQPKNTKDYLMKALSYARITSGFSVRIFQIRYQQTLNHFNLSNVFNQLIEEHPSPFELSDEYKDDL